MVSPDMNLKSGEARLDAHMANFYLGVAVVAHRGHLDIRLERLGICLLEVLQLRRPCQRADDVDVDTVLAPFGGGNAGQAANAFLCRGIRALPIVAKQPGAGGKVDDRPFVSFR